VAGRYTAIEGDLDLQALAALQADGRTASRFAYREKSEWDEYQSDAFATLALGSGRVRHRLVLGLEAGLSTADSRIGVGAAPPLDIYAPVYGPKPPEPALAPSGSDLLRLGVYVQDQLAVGSRWSLVPALRVSRLRLEDRAPAAAGLPDVADTAATPSLGVVFLLRPDLSLYASYAEGFEPAQPGQRLEDGRALEPVDSRSLEAGVKLELLGRRLAASVASFGIRQTNVPEADPRGFYRQIGEGRSRGLEAEMVGSPAPGLSVRAGYAWTVTEITRDTLGFTGHELPGAPPHKASVWARYRLPGGLGRLALAGGVVHVSDRFLARSNAVRVPSYTRLDANAFVDVVRGRLALALVGQNLTDARYVTSGAGGAFFAGPPRRLAAALNARI
jgi:iron complex outermembrane recepter protein